LINVDLKIACSILNSEILLLEPPKELNFCKMKKKPNITIVDIAKALNVSKSTVSRALSDSYDINPETK